MATLQEVEDAIRKAHAKGNLDLVKRLGVARKQLMEGGGGAGGAPAGPTEGTDQQGFLQQMFDVRNAATGESYLYGNKPKPTGFDDITRIMSDTGTRGFADKISGGGALTDAARARTSDWVETPADIVSAIATSPYRVGSMAAGAGFGALEGGLEAYGHQDDWVPDTWGEVGDIGKGMGVGAVTGGVGAKAGEWLGKGWNAINPFQKKAPYSTADELYDAADRAAKRKSPGPKNRDTLARAQRMKEVELAQTKGRGGFQEMVAGMDKPMSEVERVFGPDKTRVNWPHAEKLQASKIAHEPTNTAKWLEGAGKVISGGNIWGGIPFAKMSGGILPAIGAGLKTAAQVHNDLNPKQIETLKTMILDSTGRMKTDKATVDKARDYMAKVMMQGGESTTR